MRLAEKVHFDGLELFGETLTDREVEEWFSDEAEAYHHLYANQPGYNYEYEALNLRHGYSKLPEKRYSRALGLGAAYGHELLPIAHAVDRFVVVESSPAYEDGSVLGQGTEWVAAQRSGDIDLPTGSIDLSVCFGVLHHIPRVSHTIRELARVSGPGGYILIREPVISMGDFNSLRAGLTPHERGIPLPILRDFFRAADLETVHEAPCVFPPVAILGNRIGIATFNNGPLTAIDQQVSKLFSWNYRYHPRKWWHKFRATSAFFILRKPL